MGTKKGNTGFKAIIEQKTIRNNKQTCIVSDDIERAFDNVNWKVVQNDDENRNKVRR